MCKTVTLRINNFGPIKNAELEIDKYTVLLGPQGSGKSTIAKLFSLFTWMEKSLTMHTLSAKWAMQYSRFQKNFCKYHRIDSFFEPDTYISYHGVSHVFSYENGKFTISESEHSSYDMAKVIYVPSERNYLSFLTKASSLKGMPESMQAFLDAYKDAEVYYKSGYDLPINDITFEYDSLNDIAWIKGNKDEYKIRLSSASSGFQSMLPMTMVISYLSDSVKKKAGKDYFSSDEQEQIRKEVDKVMSNKILTDEVKLATLQNISRKFSYSRFVAIVEEPEQNLYPESQRSVLYYIISSMNTLDGNQLVITTHSPYFVNFMTVAVKAFNIRKKTSESSFVSAIDKIVPKRAQINPDVLHVYELKNGTISPLNTYDGGIPSDSNSLNDELGNGNDMFDSLLEIEDQISGGKD